MHMYVHSLAWLSQQIYWQCFSVLSRREGQWNKLPGSEYIVLSCGRSVGWERKMDKILFRGEIFRLPVLAAQVTGLFPLSLLEPKKPRRSLRLGFSWTGLGTLFFVCRVISHINSYVVFFWEGRQLKRLFQEWGRTAAASHFIVTSLVVNLDLFWALLLFWRRHQLDLFFNSLIGLIGEIWERSQGSEDESKVRQLISGKYLELRRIILIVSFLAWLAFLMALGNYVPRVHEMLVGWEIHWAFLSLVVMLFQSIVTNQVRLLSFFLLTAFMFTFQTAYAILKGKIDHSTRTRLEGQGESGPPQENFPWHTSTTKVETTRITEAAVAEGLATNVSPVEANIAWILRSFDRVEAMLKEFHSIFGYQLVIGILAILLITLICTFQVLIMCMDIVKGSGRFRLMQLASISPMLLSLLLTMYLLCDAATAMTQEAKDCVFAFRNCPDFDDLPNHVKETVLLFFIQGITKPPQVSPGKLYSLGRHLFPTVRSYAYHLSQI